MTTGAMAVILAQPADVVKVRFQARDIGQPARYSSTLKAYWNIGVKEGGRGLWKGTTSTCITSPYRLHAEIWSSCFGREYRSVANCRASGKSPFNLYKSWTLCLVISCHTGPTNYVIKIVFTAKFICLRREGSLRTSHSGYKQQMQILIKYTSLENESMRRTPIVATVYVVYYSHYPLIRSTQLHRASNPYKV